MKKKINYETVKKVLTGTMRFLASAAIMFACMKINTYADGPGANALKLVTDNVSAIAWAVLACTLLGILSKRNWIGAVITGIVGAAVCIIIGNPKMLETIGQTIVNSIFST